MLWYGFHHDILPLISLSSLLLEWAGVHDLRPLESVCWVCKLSSDEWRDVPVDPCNTWPLVAGGKSAPTGAGKPGTATPGSATGSICLIGKAGMLWDGSPEEPEFLPSSAKKYENYDDYSISVQCRCWHHSAFRVSLVSLYSATINYICHRIFMILRHIVRFFLTFNKI